MAETTIKNFIHPKTLNEALRYLENGQGKVIPVSGGISICLSGLQKIESLLDLSPLSLNYINMEKHNVVIGAGTTIRDLERSPIIQSFADGLLYKAARQLATPSIRNLVTVGGNIVQTYFWSSLPPAFLALDAKIKVVSRKGQRWLTALEFWDKHPRLLINQDEIVTEIKIPQMDGRIKSDYQCFKRVYFEYGILNLVVCLKLCGRNIDKVRIVLGAISGLPFRVFTAEEILDQQVLTPDLIEKAVKVGLGGIRPMKDLRTSPEYRKHLAQVLLQRVLTSIHNSLL